jgi:geranylgeranyl diphosphate synthase type I
MQLLRYNNFIMNALEGLEGFKKEIDKELELYLDRTIKNAQKHDVVVADALKYVKKVVLSGGKRIRPAFMYYGYLAVGGKEREKIIRASISIELVHVFLLIHDDIMDRDNTRHGIDTVHYRYEKLGKTFFSKGDFKHFGLSMAIIIGDMIGAFGNQVIYDSNFKSDLIMQALSRLQSIIAMTVIGQSQDIVIEYKKEATEKDILKMYENKTAKYTIEGPLHLGATLGGATEAEMKAMSAYAIPIGIAFQIQDDILGIFGSEKKLGKRVGSDIEEGKQTILVAKARENGNRLQKAVLKNILGKKDLTLQDIEDFRQVIKDTGSLEYAKKMAIDLILKGKLALEKMKIKKESKDFLEGIAQYLIEREL